MADDKYTPRSTTIIKLPTAMLFATNGERINSETPRLEASLINESKILLAVHTQENKKYLNISYSFYSIALEQIKDLVKEIYNGKIEAKGLLLDATQAWTDKDGETKSKKGKLYLAISSSNVWTLRLSVPGKPDIDFGFNGIYNYNISLIKPSEKDKDALSPERLSAIHLISWINGLLKSAAVAGAFGLHENKTVLLPPGVEKQVTLDPKDDDEGSDIPF